MRAVNERECEAAGVDPLVVDKIRKRLNRVMGDAKRAGIHLFCGGGNTLRARPKDGGADLIVASVDFFNADGGDGGVNIDDDGLLRGE